MDWSGLGGRYGARWGWEGSGQDPQALEAAGPPGLVKHRLLAQPRRSGWGQEFASLTRSSCSAAAAAADQEPTSGTTALALGSGARVDP